MTKNRTKKGYYRSTVRQDLDKRVAKDISIHLKFLNNMYNKETYNKLPNLFNFIEQKPWKRYNRIKNIRSYFRLALKAHKHNVIKFNKGMLKHIQESTFKLRYVKGL